MRKQWLAVTVFSMIVLMVGTDSFAQEAKKTVGDAESHPKREI